MSRARWESPVAVAYAEGLLEASKTEHNLERMLEAAGDLMTILDRAPKFEPFLAAPHIGVAERAALVRKTLAPYLPLSLTNLLLLLIERHRAEYLRRILDEFRDMAKEALGRIPAVVSSALPLSKAERMRLERVLESKTGLDLDLDYETDENLIGGIRVSFGDVVVDATLRHRLNLLSDQIATRIRESNPSTQGTQKPESA
ncbi:MAG: ATP synthase F1 subunit delta [Deltaproteobacteria bacterium]|nr:ATP synthase F1 subunit delta [Deltaproteobacteria bacterium]